MSNQLSSKIALAYTGTNATNPPNLYLRNRAPTSNDFQNVSIGDFWVYRVNRTSNNNLLYVLMGLVGNVANWVLLSNNTGVTTNLTGNTGGLVAPSMGNINVVGDGTTITITGDPLTHTLTASLIGGGAAIDTIIPNSGINVVPDGSGNVSIVGGNNITTVGTANTLTLNVSGTTNHAVQVGNATGSLTSLGVGTNGQVLVGATGANPAFATLTSSNSSITFTPGSNSLSLQTAVANPFNQAVVQTFTSSGTYTPTTGMKYCTIEVVGAGGGGGGTTTSDASNASMGGGGGGGGYARKTVTAATIGASQTVTVGAGGTAGASAGGTGGTGGTTSVGAIVSATGGDGGSGTASAPVSYAAGGTPGVGSSGDFNAYGMAGLPGLCSEISNAFAWSGQGGNSIYGGGAKPILGGGANPQAGNAGYTYGGGGSGGFSFATGAGTTGGAGAAGIVIITEYLSV